MYKYQEALERAKICGDNDCFDCKFNEICINDKKGWYGTLKELVNKAIPKKPKRDRLYYNCRNGECDKTFIYHCPVCNFSSVEDMNYCPKCGQALDWSGENDK